MHYLRHHEIDRPQWDALIEQAPNGLIYALSWYLDVVAPGWTALVKELGGRYVAVMPLPEQRRLGFRYLKQPLFAQQLGLFSLAPAAPADWREVERLLKQRFRFVTRYAFNTDNAALLEADVFGGFTTAFKTYYLSLRPTHDQLLAGYKANRRWRLNQARRRDLHLAPTPNVDLLIQIFHENTAANIYGVVGETYEYRLLRTLYARAAAKGMTEMWQAQLADGEVVAMILLLKFKQRLTYIFNSSTAMGKETGAISLLLDNVFRAYAGQDVCFDFEAPEVANIAHFYGSFGSTEMPFPTIHYNRLPWPVRLLKAARMRFYRRQ